MNEVREQSGLLKHHSITANKMASFHRITETELNPRCVLF